jgi:orotate phosphoribosyltransferase
MNASSKKLPDLLHASQGHFKLESGHHGNLWLDLDRLFLRPQEIQPFAVELARKISSFDIDAVCGPMVGGGLLAQTIAIVDDVINAGSAVRGTLAELEPLGASPIVIGALLVLGETGRNDLREKDLPIAYIDYLPNEIWTPANCPLCTSQIPLDNPN